VILNKEADRTLSPFDVQIISDRFKVSYISSLITEHCHFVLLSIKSSLLEHGLKLWNY